MDSTASEVRELSPHPFLLPFFSSPSPPLPFPLFPSEKRGAQKQASPKVLKSGAQALEPMSLRLCLYCVVDMPHSDTKTAKQSDQRSLHPQWTYLHDNNDGIPMNYKTVCSQRI